MNDTLLLLTILGSVAAGTVGGVFYAFSVFVMRALEQLPPEQGVAAMQRINITVITPLFLGAFLGCVPLLAAAAFLAYGSGAAGAMAWLLFALLTYTMGSLGVTMAFNVPRNNRLAVLAAASPEARSYWCSQGVAALESCALPGVLARGSQLRCRSRQVTGRRARMPPEPSLTTPTFPSRPAITLNAYQAP